MSRDGHRAQRSSKLYLDKGCKVSLTLLTFILALQLQFPAKLHATLQIGIYFTFPYVSAVQLSISYMAALKGSEFYWLIITVSSLLFQFSVDSQAEKRHLYVKPTPTSSDCPRRETCLTLSEYLQNVSDFFTSNTAVHFLPGNHTLSSSGPNHDPLFAMNIHNFSLFGLSSRNTILNCTEKLGFAIINSVNINILNIKINNCGQTITALLDEYSLNIHKDTKAALVFINVYSLVLQNVQIKGSHGYGLFGADVWGNSNFKNCTFTHNGWKQVDINSNYSNTENPPGGNVLLVFPCSKQLLLSNLESRQFRTLALNISHCEFAHGIATFSLDFESWHKSSYMVTGGSGLGILFYRKVGSQQSCDNFLNIHIADSIFHHNRSPYGLGANMLILFHFYLRNDRIGKVSFTSDICINKCDFRDGEALEGGGIFVGHLTDSSETKLIIKISNSTLSHNIARSNGGGLYFMSKLGKISTYQRYGDGYLDLMNCNFGSNRAKKGAGVHISIFLHWQFLSYHVVNHIIILQSTFLQNTATISGGGIYIYLSTIITPKTIIAGRFIVISCTSCLFLNNKALVGCAAYVEGCGQIDHGRGNSFDSCQQAYRIFVEFYSTVISKNDVHRNFGYATLYIQNIERFELRSSNITENFGTAIHITGSELFIYDAVNVIGNHGYSGGGLHSECHPQSFVYLKPQSQLYLANNTASYHGGAIFVNDCRSKYNTDCFIQIEDLYKSSNTIGNVKIVLENNTAEVAGNSIYGGSLETCYLHHYDSDKARILSTLEINSTIFQFIFKINKGTHSMSEVTSDPFQICFCDINKLECVTETHVEVYRGQAFHIPAVGVGQFNNASPAIVRTIIPSDHTGELGEKQTIQELGRVCGLLSYIVRSSENATQLQISVEGAYSYNIINIHRLALIYVTFIKCPPGLELSSDFSVCDCEPHLKNYGIMCETGTWIFHRPASMWIGYYREKQVVIHPNCPFHYCKSEDANLSLNNQDDQCAFNHSGVLCGACQQGLSLTLGTSQCLKCSNVYLLLLIPFALAGVVLVFLLLKCNLTVSAGSVNGLIFYANIIQVNQATFFPHRAQGVSFCTKFFSVFIAWLNLDLGIQTCFFAGMTAYSKTWLQFLFPVYVWIMVGIMIYGSRYSPTVFRLVGSNAVPVLATLFLLSYAKLLRTVITAVYSTTLTGRDSSTSSVWLVDGNVPFFRGTHIALLLMALVIIIVYIAPFTLFILLAPCLQANSNHRMLQKITIKLKPLLDAYQGPYKDKFRYWTGLMLLLRTILFAIFAGNVFGKPEINLFTVDLSIYLLLICLWNAGRVYKTLVWNIIESFYLLNLAILTTATLLLRSLGEPSSNGQEIATGVMVGTAFAVFCAIVLYHFYVCLRSTRLLHPVWRALRKEANQRTGAATDAAAHRSPSNINAVYVQSDNVSVSHVNFIQLREPLLLCSDND